MGSTMVSGTKMAVGDAFLTAVLGYATVFAGILLLILVVIIVGKIMTARKEEAAKVQETAPAAVKPAAPAAKPAPGSAGDLKLYDTDPRTAAMIMAIVADNFGKPINELRFKSIREVKEDEV